jgi:ABC-2 type transport system ATP-binding protein
MKIITCYLQQDSGKVQVCNLNIQEQDIQVKAKIGYLPEHNPLYTDMYIKEYLSFIGGIYEVENLNNRVAEIIMQTGLISEQSKKIRELSKGYRQRVGLASALLHNPEVLILDEPTTGLDPNQLVEIRNLIKEVGKDKAVLLSTHIMQEVDKMCSRVIIISKGKIVDDQLISNLKNNKINLEEHFRKLTA